MNDEPFMSRVKGLADAAMQGASETNVCPIDRPCPCPTCGVTLILLRNKLINHGFELADVKKVTLIGNDFRGASHPYIASLRVAGVEVYRVMQRPDEVLQDDVIRDVARQLRGEGR
jgi:hypothetical protein